MAILLAQYRVQLIKFHLKHLWAVCTVKSVHVNWRISSRWDHIGMIKIRCFWSRNPIIGVLWKKYCMEFPMCVQTTGKVNSDVVRKLILWVICKPTTIHLTFEGWKPVVHPDARLAGRCTDELDVARELGILHVSGWKLEAGWKGCWTELALALRTRLLYSRIPYFPPENPPSPTPTPTPTRTHPPTTHFTHPHAKSYVSKHVGGWDRLLF